MGDVGSTEAMSLGPDIGSYQAFRVSYATRVIRDKISG